MERAPLVSKSVLFGRELTEVLGSFGNSFVVELEDDSTSGLAVDVDIKLDDVRCQSQDRGGGGPASEASARTKTLDILVSAVCVKKGETKRSEKRFGR